MVKPHAVAHDQRRRALSLAVLSLLCTGGLGCALREEQLCPECGDASAPDAAQVSGPPLSWGEYSATLPIPPCPAGQLLTVTTTEEGLADGGVDFSSPTQVPGPLSLTQALRIALNHPGPDTIRFDPELFAAQRPLTLELTEPTTPGTRVIPELCLDGRGSGVVLRGKSGTSDAYPLPWTVGPGSLVVGLTLLDLPSELDLRGSQIAGNRIGTDGQQGYPCRRPWALVTEGQTRVGPGNVFGPHCALRNLTGGKLEVRGNWFGVDPLTRLRLGLRQAADLDLSQALELIFEDNVLATSGPAISFQGHSGSGGSGVIARNFHGVLPDGSVLGAVGPLATIGEGAFTVGPDNIVRGASPALELTGPYVRVTRNSISLSPGGIEGSGLGPTPTLGTDGSTVSGTCPVDGTLEFFADAADQGERFLGELACTADQPWRFPSSGAQGQNLTATLHSTGRSTSRFSPAVAVPCLPGEAGPETACAPDLEEQERQRVLHLGCGAAQSGGPGLLGALLWLIRRRRRGPSPRWKAA